MNRQRSMPASENQHLISMNEDIAKTSQPNLMPAAPSNMSRPDQVFHTSPVIPRLLMTEQGLTLTDGSLSLCPDFADSIPRLRPDRLGGELLVRAARIRGAKGPLTAIDATAGLGEDSLLLAAAGFSVRLCERDPVIAALLADALRRAADHPPLREIVSRMELVETDSAADMRSLDFSPDIIYLDPMFPERKKSGLVGKKFQLLQQLERPCTDETELLSAALAACPRRIVIKRPLHGPYLGGRKPSYSLTGKAIRYDCIAVRGS